MTNVSDENVERADILVARAMKVFDVTQEALEQAIDRLRAEEGVTPGQITKDLKEMGSALNLAMQMEGRARDAKIKSDGGIGAGQLDLDAARDEIGCRLDCLRAARGGGELPQQSE